MDFYRILEKVVSGKFADTGGIATLLAPPDETAEKALEIIRK